MILSKVEDRLDFWENTGRLASYDDPFNVAIVIETQSEVNASRGVAEELADLFNDLAERLAVEGCLLGLYNHYSCDKTVAIEWLPDTVIDITTAQELVDSFKSVVETLVYFGGFLVEDGCICLKYDSTNSNG
jgi:hypothetical protein